MLLQDLCRQRMQSKSTEKPEPLNAASRIGSVSTSDQGNPNSPSSRSSTSSWWVYTVIYRCLLAQVGLYSIYAYEVWIVKCYCGGWKIHLILSVSKILSQNRYHCIQCTKHHHKNLMSNWKHRFLPKLPHSSLLLFILNLATLPQASFRINYNMFK